MSSSMSMGLHRFKKLSPPSMAAVRTKPGLEDSGCHETDDSHQHGLTNSAAHLRTKLTPQSYKFCLNLGLILKSLKNVNNFRKFDAIKKKIFFSLWFHQNGHYHPK